MQEQLAAIQRERDELDRECNEIQEKHRIAVLNIQKLEEKIELLEEQIAIFPSEQAIATSEHLEEIEELRRQVAELQQELAHRPSEPAPAIGELPEPAILLNQLKGKHPISKVSLKDVEAILELLEG